MALDAGMVSCLVHELKEKITGAKVEKIYQPSKDELVFSLRKAAFHCRLLLSCAPGNARICLTEEKYENPAVAPMFCMLLRKHLTGAKICALEQPGFERVVILSFDAFDELGFPCKKHLVLELVGKFSNTIFLNEAKKITGAVKTVDFSTSEQRQILPGLTYELPPAQDKANPLAETKDAFMRRLSAAAGNADRFIVSSYLGISPLVAREIVYQAEKKTDRPVSDCEPEKLWFYFHSAMERILKNEYAPTLIRERNGTAVEYSFLPLSQYGVSFSAERYDSPSEVVQKFFSVRALSERIRQKSSDIFRLLSNAQTRLNKKIAKQREELSECGLRDTYKLYADLLTANLYALKRGADRVSLVNYYSESGEIVEVPLDTRLNPSANAQRYYKKYNKAKAAERELTHQIELANADLSYIDTVFDALRRAQSTDDLDEIREELYLSGFASKMKGYEKKKRKTGKPLEFVTSEGFRVLCGRNNTQNDLLTTKIAAKSDYWFHVKDAPGSHVILCCGGEEPGAASFTEAAQIAAAHSKLCDGENVAVDYTLVRNVKKPSGAKPGFVIYHTNWTAYVSPVNYNLEREKQ